MRTGGCFGGPARTRSTAPARSSPPGPGRVGLCGVAASVPPISKAPHDLVSSHPARLDDTVDDAVSCSDNNEYPEESFDELSGDAAGNRALRASITAASTAARTPGISDDLFDLFRDVTTSLTVTHAARSVE